MVLIMQKYENDFCTLFKRDLHAYIAAICNVGLNVGLY